MVAWIRRFTHNCRSKSRKHNALSTREIQEAGRCLVRMSQTAKMLENDYQEISQRLGLTLDEEGILRCRGRVTGEYPVYIPTNSMLARRIIEDARERTLHGGTTLTMANIRDRYWIERLRRSVKSMINKCYKCYNNGTTSRIPDPWRTSVSNCRCGFCWSSRVLNKEWLILRCIHVRRPERYIYYRT